ncbi:MAG: 4-diphosphocytidyl-2C-methyl-D-erythritol synthase [Sphingomicrobium sp.]
MREWTALLLAGSRPGGDPFAAAHGAKVKALIPVAGEAMILRPVRALLANGRVGSVRILTQDMQLLRPVLPDDARLSVEASGATIAATIEAIIADPSTRWPLLVTTADHALLDNVMIEDFCSRAQGADLAIGLVERAALMSRLPQTKRTWIGFRGGAYSGANLFALGSPKAAAAVRLWREVEQDRKKGWKLLAMLGLPGLLGLMRLWTLDKTVAKIGLRLGLSIRAIRLVNPLAAVDVDKPDDLALVEKIIAGAT